MTTLLERPRYLSDRHAREGGHPVEERDSRFHGNDILDTCPRLHGGDVISHE